MQKEIELDSVKGILDTFIIEPIVLHKDEEELYICIQSHRPFDEIYFYHQGGVDVGDVDAKALRMQIPVGENTVLASSAAEEQLLKEIPAAKKAKVADFII